MAEQDNNLLAKLHDRYRIPAPQADAFGRTPASLAPITPSPKQVEDVLHDARMSEGQRKSELRRR